MKRLFRRVMYNLGSLISAFFNIGISLKFVILVCVILTAGTYFITNKVAIDNVGGAADYAEAMRYIEIKDIVDEKFIDTVDRGAMGDSAAAAMVAGLGDKWSYYMSSDEYKTYQLYSSDEYSDIGLSIMKDDSGGYQVISVNPGSPAAWAGLTPGMVITDVDGEDVTAFDADYVRQLIRGKLNTVFSLGINFGQNTITVDCTGFYVSPVSYRMEKTEAGYIKIDNFEAGSGQELTDLEVSTCSTGYDNRFYPDRELYYCGRIKNAAIQMALLMQGDLPDTMIRYRDGNGEHELLISLSGEDGSYLLTENPGAQNS